jgi:hypothetical protein
MEKKEKTQKEIINNVSKGALLTSKEYKVSVNKETRNLFSVNAFFAFLKAILPKGYNVTIAENVTGKGETLKVWKNDTLVERFFFPSNKVSYQGIGFGMPQLKAMAEAGIDTQSLSLVRQGKKEYWYTENVQVISEYLNKKYSNKE